MRRRLCVLIPGALVGIACGVPLLLFGMLIGSRLLMIVAGPVNLWNTTWHTPPIAQIAGEYRVSKDSSELRLRLPHGHTMSDRSGFTLGADHSIEVTDVSAFDGFGEAVSCTYRGTGTWRSAEGGGDGVTLSFDITVTPLQSPPGEPASCAPTSVGPFYLLGHSAPYRMWYGVGDPDSGTGLLYRQSRH
jgi:hypothetical protein